MFINPTKLCSCKSTDVEKILGGRRKIWCINIGIVELRVGRESSQIIGQVVLEFGILK